MDGKQAWRNALELVRALRAFPRLPYNKAEAVEAFWPAKVGEETGAPVSAGLCSTSSCWIHAVQGRGEIMQFFFFTLTYPGMGLCSQPLGHATLWGTPAPCWGHLLPASPFPKTAEIALTNWY